MAPGRSVPCCRRERTGIINRVAKFRVLLGVLVVLISAVGCGQASDQSQALEEERQRNEELQQEIDAQKRAQEEAEEREQAEKQEELEREVSELRAAQEREAQEESEQQEDGSQVSESEPSDSPEVIIQSNDDWTASPSQAEEGVVVVSPDYDVQAVSTEEAYAIDAAIAYYQAVEIGDYYTTHSLLSVEDQNLHPVDAWVQANTNLDSAAGEFVVTGAYPDSTVNPGYPTYAVTLTVYLPDGSSFDRTTYFTDEGNGYWAHWLSQEEMDLFNGAL